MLVACEGLLLSSPSPSPPLSPGAVEYKEKLGAALVELGCTQSEVKALLLSLGHVWCDWSDPLVCSVTGVRVL